MGDGAANPHLVIAASLFAGIDGIKRELDPGDAARRRRLHAARGRAGRPAAVVAREALDALEADEVIGDAVGPDIVDTFLAMKGFELERHRQHVSDWDLDEYMHHL